MRQRMCSGSGMSWCQLYEATAAYREGHAHNVLEFFMSAPTARA